MELTISIILILMILGAIYAIHAKDLLSAVITCGIIGYGLVVCFLMLKAPDLAIVQIVVETITLIIMVAVVLDSSKEELILRFNTQNLFNTILAFTICFSFAYFFHRAIIKLDLFGEHTLRMSEAYIVGAAEKTGSINLVTGVIFDFRGYDTLGEATVLFTAVLGVLSILRVKGKI